MQVSISFDRQSGINAHNAIGSGAEPVESRNQSFFSLVELGERTFYRHQSVTDMLIPRAPGIAATMKPMTLVDSYTYGDFVFVCLFLFFVCSHSRPESDPN